MKKQFSVFLLLCLAGALFLPACKKQLPPVEIELEVSTLGANAPLDVNVRCEVISGEVTDYYWEFGDGATASGSPDASHQYSAAGEYTIRLTVTGLEGSEGAPQTVTKTATATINLAAPPDPEPPTDGLVAYYSFDGNAQDESGFNNHGSTNNGVQFIRNRKNEENKAVYFDGIDDFIKVPHSGGINFGKDQDFTISLWLKYGSQEDVTNPDNDILSKWDGGYPFVIRLLNQTATSKQGAWYAARWDGNCQHSGEAGGPSISDQQFHHVVFVKRGTLLYGYTDGVETSQEPDNTICETKNNAPLYIGARNEIRHNSYKGAMDDLRIYNRALTAEEIGLLFKE